MLSSYEILVTKFHWQLSMNRPIVSFDELVLCVILGDESPSGSFWPICHLVRSLAMNCLVVGFLVMIHFDGFLWQTYLFVEFLVMNRLYGSFYWTCRLVEFLMTNLFSTSVNAWRIMLKALNKHQQLRVCIYTTDKITLVEKVLSVSPVMFLSWGFSFFFAKLSPHSFQFQETGFHYLTWYIFVPFPSVENNLLLGFRLRILWIWCFDISSLLLHKQSQCPGYQLELLQHWICQCNYVETCVHLA